MASPTLYEWELTTRYTIGGRREKHAVIATAEIAMLTSDGGAGVIVFHDTAGEVTHVEAMLGTNAVGLLRATRLPLQQATATAGTTSKK